MQKFRKFRPFWSPAIRWRHNPLQHRFSAGCLCGRYRWRRWPLLCERWTYRTWAPSAETSPWRPCVSCGRAGEVRPLPPSLFPSKYPPFLTQFRVLPTQVLAFVLSTCWVRHSHHASTSPSSTLLLTRVCPPSVPPLLASGPTFSAAAVSQLCYRRHGCRGKRFRFVGGHHRQSMLLTGLHFQYRRVVASIDAMKEHRFMRELYS